MNKKINEASGLMACSTDELINSRPRQIQPDLRCYNADHNGYNRINGMQDLRCYNASYGTDRRWTLPGSGHERGEGWRKEDRWWSRDVRLVGNPVQQNGGCCSWVDWLSNPLLDAASLIALSCCFLLLCSASIKIGIGISAQNKCTHRSFMRTNCSPKCLAQKRFELTFWEGRYHLGQSPAAPTP